MKIRVTKTSETNDHISKDNNKFSINTALGNFLYLLFYVLKQTQCVVLHHTFNNLYALKTCIA